MSRSQRRPSTGVQAETAPPTANAELPAQVASAAETARLGLGWRIALVVWVLGFVGLALLELLRFGWHLLR